MMLNRKPLRGSFCGDIPFPPVAALRRQLGATRQNPYGVHFVGTFRSPSSRLTAPTGGYSPPHPTGFILSGVWSGSDIDAMAARIAAGNSDAAKAYCANGAIAELLAAYGAVAT